MSKYWITAAYIACIQLFLTCLYFGIIGVGFMLDYKTNLLATIGWKYNIIGTMCLISIFSLAIIIVAFSGMRWTIDQNLKYEKELENLHKKEDEYLAEKTKFIKLQNEYLKRLSDDAVWELFQSLRKKMDKI